MEALVVLEAGTELPPFVDAHCGAESNVYVLCERDDEHVYAFEGRMLDALERLDVGLAVLVCGSAAGRERTSVRASLLGALRESTECRGGRLMLAALEASSERDELARLFGAEVVRLHEGRPIVRERRDGPTEQLALAFG